MSEKVKETIIKTVDHPLETFFDIAPNTTEVAVQVQSTTLVKDPNYDEKDTEIEDDLQGIHDKAMAGHDMLQDQIEDIDPRYVPRVSEVAIAYLDTALKAVSEKAKIKANKDKIANKASGPQSVTNNNTIIMDRNDALQKIRDKIIDVSSAAIENSKK